MAEWSARDELTAISIFSSPRLPNSSDTPIADSLRAVGAMREMSDGRTGMRRAENRAWNRKGLALLALVHGTPRTPRSYAHGRAVDPQRTAGDHQPLVDLRGLQGDSRVIRGWQMTAVLPPPWDEIKGGCRLSPR